MPALPCPHCTTAIEVAISRAGSEVVCPQCQGNVTVPKLGELRQLQSSADADVNLQRDEAATPWRVAFTVLAVATAFALLLSGYCLVRWAAIEVPLTMDEHLAHIQEFYLQAPPAELIADWQAMETYRPELAGPHHYQAIADTRADWRNKGILGAVIACVTAAMALFCGSRASAANSP